MIRCDELIADTRNRCDPVLAIGGLAEHFAKLCDLHGKIAFLDRFVAPGTIEQFRFGKYLSAAVEQRRQELQAAPSQRHNLVALEQDPGLFVHAEGSELMGRRIHAPP
jgi:hypothetical protein